MKKTLGLLSLLSLLVLTGCSLKNIGTPSTTTGDTTTTGTLSLAMDYSGDLIVAGVGPKTSFEQTIGDDTLALKKTFDDHSDHVYFARELRSNYLDIQQDAIPGNTIRFVGMVKAMDAAAGNHYYEVISVSELKKIATPTKAEVTDLIARYAACETDADCVGIYGKCPLACQIAINTNFSGVVDSIINNFRDAQESQCTYKCMEIKKVVCNTKSMCEIQN
jgi:hypothetical protein